MSFCTIHSFWQGLRPFESNVNTLCIYLYIRKEMNICYLLLAICCALVLFLGWRLSTERVVAQPLYLLLFPSGVTAIGGLQIVLQCATHSKCVHAL